MSARGRGRGCPNFRWIGPRTDRSIEFLRAQVSDRGGV